MSGRLAQPGLLPGEGWKRHVRWHGRVRIAAVAANSTAGIGLLHSEVRARPVWSALALLWIAAVSVSHVMPGHVGKIAVLMHKDPGGLLQNAVAFAAIQCALDRSFVRHPGGFVLLAWRSPGSPMQQAASDAARPGWKPKGRDPSDGGAIVLHRAWRRAERFADVERGLDAFYIPDLTVHRIAAFAIPVADVLHYHQAVGTAHDRSHRAIAKEMGEPNRKIFVSHDASALSGSRWTSGTLSIVTSVASIGPARLQYLPRCAWSARSARGRDAPLRGCREAGRNSFRCPVPGS